MRQALALALLLAAAACSTDGKPRTGGVCPESQEVCLNGRDCTTDRIRGCELCRCRPAGAFSPVGPARAHPEDEREPKLPPLR